MVAVMDVRILPYVIFLIVPILGRMTDADDEVRLLATNTFATLVKLVPLEVSLAKCRISDANVKYASRLVYRIHRALLRSSF